MIGVDVKGCNNVLSAKLEIRKNELNIRYAVNGTGKTTIAKAIKSIADKKPLNELQTFGLEDEPECLLSEDINKVMLFNEDFVNTLVFQQSEVIQNSFEVFIKSPDYDKNQRAIDERLKKIHVDITKNEDIQRLLYSGRNVLGKFSLTTTGKFKQTGVYKTLKSSQSIFKLPTKLVKFQPLMEKDYTVDWVGWKNDGSKYDDNNICPFCTTPLDDEYETEKELFTTSYKKSDVKNRLELLSYFDNVREFMTDDKVEKLSECAKGLKNEDELEMWLLKFYFELKTLVEKVSAVGDFNASHVRREDISNLSTQLTEMIIDISDYQIFCNQTMQDLVEFVNGRIKSVIKDVEFLKNEIGELKGLISSAKKKAIRNINEFLSIAGISYEFDIVDEEYENQSHTILRYISSRHEPIEVDDIPMHLSWGERNAFALVLFMHYALSQSPDMIILDDPISSFDSNKKYAIISRLFSSRVESNLCDKTVLMLTHDMQPIIDFIIVNKPNNEHVSAYYLQNDDGIISEVEIAPDDICSLPILLLENAKSGGLNVVHRIASLRKYLEHVPNEDKGHQMAYELLSCLIHGKQKPTYIDEMELTATDITEGEKYIKDYISDFSYKSYSENLFSIDNLLKDFVRETNSYVKLQIFRVILAITKLRNKIEDPLLKYIDEQFHIENDYMFTLDYMKYDMVPVYIIPKCCDFLRSKNLIT